MVGEVYGRGSPGMLCRTPKGPAGYPGRGTCPALRSLAAARIHRPLGRWRGVSFGHAITAFRSNRYRGEYPRKARKPAPTLGLRVFVMFTQLANIYVRQLSEHCSLQEHIVYTSSERHVQSSRTCCSAGEPIVLTPEQKQPRAKQTVSDEALVRAQGQHLAEQNTAEKRSKKNWNFVQIERKTMGYMRDLIEESPLAAKLLFLFGEKMNRDNAIVISYHTLEKITGKGRTALHNAITLLKKRQWLQVVKVGTANAYVINNAVFWRGEGDQKQAHFRAAIVASFDEQDQREQWDGIQLKHFPVLQHDARIDDDSGAESTPNQPDLDLN